MKKILLLTTLLTVALQLQAAPVDMTAARNVAMRFAQEMKANGLHRAPATSADAQLVLSERNSADASQTVYYIFNTADSYIIVAGDDRAEQVLAYGDNPFEVNNIPDGMQYWLDCYKQQIEYLQARPDLIVDQPAQRRAPIGGAVSVEPLLTALWSQEAPYYYQCPTSGGQYCVTGCAATSLSMILYYWRFPEGPSPALPAYRTSSLQLYVGGLEPMTFDWDHMLDRYRGNYTNEQANAVAWLMRYVGQAEHMDYTPSASGVQAWNISQAVETFGFDSDATMVYKENYSDEQWAAMIQEELEQGRPLEYCGFGGMSGHAFNVDGYDAETDKYHINWGWGGSANGYCALNAFRGGGTTYRTGQLMIIGLQPPVTQPTIKIKTHRVELASLVGKSSTATIHVKGRLLTDAVTLKLNDESGTFALNTTNISLNYLTYGTNVSVTYRPTEPGVNTATITLSSPGAKDEIITLTGLASLETYDPVMLEASDVTTSSFIANWNDLTPTGNVSTYSLEAVRIPFSESRFQADFGAITSNGSSSSDCSSDLEALTGIAGWTGNKVYRGDGYLRLGNAGSTGWLQTPAIDLLDNNGLVTVKVTAKTTPTETEALLKISCGDADTTIVVNNEATQYSVLLPCPAGKDVSVRLANRVKTQRVLVCDVEVLAGDDHSPIDWTSGLHIDNISGTSMALDHLEPATYALRVQAHYTDGTMSQWSNDKRVTLDYAKGDVNRDGEINIADANTIINVILNPTGNPTRTISLSDVNGDGEVNIADINAIINMILLGH